jgi:hypothetical protein
VIARVNAKARVGSKLNKLAGQAGLSVYQVVLGDAAGREVHLQVHLGDGQSPRSGLSADEDAARRFLGVKPDLELQDSSGLLKLIGTMDGITFQVYTGSGSAEKVLEAV